MIKFHAVSKIFAKEVGAAAHTALRDLSFSLEPGQTLGLVGANGAGKSTSIKLLMDFIRPSSGAIELFGAPPDAPLLRRRVGYLPEVANFPANLTVLDLLRFTASTCGIAKIKRTERGENLLRLLDLWEARKRPLRTFSKGMQQRANFAIALVNDPELLILDEPMSGLDPMGRAKISELISRLREEGKTILFCSHILEDVDRLVDSVLLLHKGERLFLGAPKVLVREEGVQTLAEAFVSRVSREEQHV